PSRALLPREPAACGTPRRYWKTALRVPLLCWSRAQGLLVGWAVKSWSRGFTLDRLASRKALSRFMRAAHPTTGQPGTQSRWPRSTASKCHLPWDHFSSTTVGGAACSRMLRLIAAEVLTSSTHMILRKMVVAHHRFPQTFRAAELP